MNLTKIAGNTYYISNRTNIGVYKVDEENVYIIDSGNDSEAGRKILKMIKENGWNIKGIISTHSNADHIGGNSFIQSRTGAKILAHNMERCFIEYPLLEPSFLYGGCPYKELRNKFLMAKPSVTISIEDIPDGIEFFLLKGHFYDMVGIHTDDDVYFLGDALFSEETIEKYHVFFIYDVREFLNTLDYLETLNGELFIASHCEPMKDIKKIIEINRKKVVEILDLVHNYLEEPKTFEEILKFIFDYYNITMNAEQHILIGSTIKSYLSYLKDENRVEYEFSSNRMYWKKFH